MVSTRREQRWLRRGPALVVVVTLGVLSLSWLAVLLVDVFNAFGLRDVLFVERNSDYPYVFYHLFADNHPIEWLQWLLLIIAVVAVGMTAGMLRADRGPVWGVGLLALGLSVVALQDAGNQRHVATDLAAGVGGELAGTLAGVVSLGFVALLALGGLATAWPVIRPRTAVRNLFLAGYGVFGVVGLMEAMPDLWYVRAGRAVVDSGLGGRVLDAPATWEPGLLEWLLIDAVVEESLELIAAGCLAAAALVLLRAVTSRPPDRVEVMEPSRTF